LRATKNVQISGAGRTQWYNAGVGIGQKIKDYRAANALSQEDFGKLVGVHGSTVARWECGATQPSGSALKTITELLEESRLPQPDQLRHSFTDRVRKLHGADVARASAGHASLDATELYLERDVAIASAVAAELG
jgi:transcriptional regulator with XRE-family HTH domain